MWIVAVIVVGGGGETGRKNKKIWLSYLALGQNDWKNFRLYQAG